MRFVNLEALQSADLPVEPSKFEEMVKQQCAHARNLLKNEYVV